MIWARLLAYITGTVNQELLLKNEYLVAENRILRAKIKRRLVLSEGEKTTLAEIAHRLGRKGLEEVATTAQPDTILGWYRKLIAKKLDGSKFRQRMGRPKIDGEAERLVVRVAKENPSWGYDRIVGALANLGCQISDQTVGNILKRHGLSPAPKRKQTISWKDFIRSHMAVLAGTDFFTVEVFTLKGLMMKSPGVWELTLAKPIATLTHGTLNVSVKDKSGNISQIERSFTVEPGKSQLTAARYVSLR